MKYSEDRKSQISITAISDILCEWDPLDLMNDPDWPKDEYDNYINEITMQLDKGISENDLALLLENIASSYMCVSTGKSNNIAIAKKLIFHWKQYAVY